MFHLISVRPFVRLSSTVTVVARNIALNFSALSFSSKQNELERVREEARLAEILRKKKEEETNELRQKKWEEEWQSRQQKINK